MFSCLKKIKNKKGAVSLEYAYLIIAIVFFGVFSISLISNVTTDTAKTSTQCLEDGYEYDDEAGECISLEYNDDKITKYQYFNISYELNDGVLVNAPVSYEVGGSDFYLGIPIKPGFVFKGWTGSNGEEPQGASGSGLILPLKNEDGSYKYEDYHFIANWEDGEFVINFHLNGGAWQENSFNSLSPNVNMNFNTNTLTYKVGVVQELPKPTKDANPYVDKISAVKTLYNVGEDNLTDDDVITINGIDCYVLQIDEINNKAEIITKGIYNVAFDTSTSLQYRYNESSLKTWMDNFYINSLNKDKYILKTTVNYGYAPSTRIGENVLGYTFDSLEQYVSLLSADVFNNASKFKWDDVTNFIDDSSTVAKGFWIPLGFPKRLLAVNTNAAFYIENTGNIVNGIVNCANIGARPTFWINLNNTSKQEFLGWWTKDGSLSGDWGNNITSIKSTDAQNMQLYAKFPLATYTIKFDANGGSAPSITSINATYGNSYTFPSATTKTGYMFAGWNTKPDGSGTNYNASSINSNLSNTNGDVIILYAKWLPISYTIKFDANGGSTPSITSINATYGNSYTFPSATIKQGYIFAGWNTKPDGTGTNYNSNTSYELPVLSSDTVITLYAKWVDNVIGYYADADNDGMWDGMIFFDYFYGADATPGFLGNGVVVNPKTENLASYEIKTLNYYTLTQDVVVKISEGNDRFYVMKPNSEYFPSSYSEPYWYANATSIPDWNTLTSTAFGTGKTNTQNIRNKWTAQAYGSNNARDIWMEENFGDWFIPSKDEWLVFGSNFKKYASNYDRSGGKLKIDFPNGTSYTTYQSMHWSSSLCDANNVWRTDFLNTSGTMEKERFYYNGAVSPSHYVRLITTF